MSGNLYQLRSETQCPLGSYFPVDGPYDTHGFVVKSEKKDGYWLNLVRGTGNRRPDCYVERQKLLRSRK